MNYIRKTADILISEELRQVLQEFEHKSLVAKLLLKGRHSKSNLVDGFVNYISISKTDSSKISYLSQDRMAKIDQNEYWTTSKRFIAKPGAFVNKIFKDIPAREIELFSNIFQLQNEQGSLSFRTVSGNQIKKWYYWENYQSQCSSLGSSCMKHDSCQDYLTIYTQNPEVCKMLILVDSDDMLVGRALLWNIDGDKHKIMDRIYTVNDDKYQHKFKDWADKNGYWYKSEQKWNNCLWFESNGKVELKEIEFDLPNFQEGDSLPYMDTFKFGNIKSGKIYNYIPESHRNIRTFIASDGGYYDWDCLAKDDFTNIYYQRGDTAMLNYLDKRSLISNLNYSESNDCYILKEHSIWMEQIRDYIFNEEYNSFNNTDKIEKRAMKYGDNHKKLNRLFDFSFDPYSQIHIDLAAEVE
jgi:hypothetical protein